MLGYGTIFVLGTAVASCATSPVPLGLPCTVGPIILDKTDHLSRQTAEQVVALNNSGAQLCHWQPPH